MVRPARRIGQGQRRRVPGSNGEKSLDTREKRFDFHRFREDAGEGPSKALAARGVDDFARQEYEGQVRESSFQTASEVMAVELGHVEISHDERGRHVPQNAKASTARRVETQQ